MGVAKQAFLKQGELFSLVKSSPYTPLKNTLENIKTLRTLSSSFYPLPQKRGKTLLENFVFLIATEIKMIFKTILFGYSYFYALTLPFYKKSFFFVIFMYIIVNMKNLSHKIRKDCRVMFRTIKWYFKFVFCLILKNNNLKKI